MVWKHLYQIIYEGVQENIVILNVTIFCVQTEEPTSNFVVQLLHLLRVKQQYFPVFLLEAKKIQKILKTTT